jgi:Cu-Zn family superoxide dismutase
MDDNAYEEVEQPEEMAPETAAAEATATLKTADGTEIGTVTFTEDAMGGSVQISAELHGVAADGMHGFHLHENGECSAPDFTSAGGHFNPDGVDHACPPTTPRHAGDFGNVEISGGAGSLDASSDLLTVNAGPRSVVGHAVILHGGEDDCATQPSGDAGPRYACGVVTLGGMEGDMGMGMAGDEAMDDEGMEGEGDGGVQ